MKEIHCFHVHCVQRMQLKCLKLQHLRRLLASWQLLPEVPELIRICVDIKYFDVGVSENNKKYLLSDSI